MSRQTTQLTPARHKGHRPWGRKPGAIELSAVAVRPAVHYTRTWSATTEAVPFAFRLAVLPVRLLAHSLLWATSSPPRLCFTAALSATAVLALLA